VRSENVEVRRNLADLQIYRNLVLRVSVVFFEEGAEEVYHGDALGDGF
jgi:hypothetical protein